MELSAEEINGLEGFQDLDEKQLKWLMGIAEHRQLKKDEYVFRKGDEAKEMYAVLEGKIELWTEANGNWRNFATQQRGAISGLLPYSRLKEANGNAIASEPSRLMVIHKKHFPEMEQRMPDLVQYLVGLMTNRVRDFTRSQQQQEKMVSLGKLAAGLAHELNNPAAAISRTVEALQTRIGSMNRRAAALLTAGIPSDCLQEAAETISCKIEFKIRRKLTAMERSELEDTMVERLEEIGVEEAYEMAEIFLDSGMGLEEVEDILKSVNKASYIPMLEWTVNVVAAQKLSKEISEASKRISKLVGSIKSYSHMDRGQAMEEVDIHEGLESTLTMLGHKIKEKNIRTELPGELDIPKIEAYGSELNQVWTNLLDNAIDALQQGGVIKINAGRENGLIYVSIQDNGSGIPAETLDKIFDPFFTTKEVGKGTGLGLDIVNRIVESHKGNIKVTSEPGNTEFKVFLPLKQESI